MKKRLLSALLAVCLVVGMVPTAVFAATKTPVKVTSVTVTNLSSITPEVVVDADPIDLDSLADVVIAAGIEGSGTSATDITSHSAVKVVGTPSVTSGAEKRTDGKYYWKAGAVATITVKVTAYTDDTSYTPSLALTGTDTVGSWIVTQSGSTVTAKYDKNGDGKITTSGTDNDTIAYLEDGTTLTGTYVDATTESATDIGGALSVTVVEGQKAYLYLSSLNEQELKGGSISVDSGSVPTYFIKASGSGNPATITIEGVKSTENATGGTVSFNLKTAKSGNCDAQVFPVTVTVEPKIGGFQLASPVTSLKINDTANLTATVTAADGTIIRMPGDESISADNMRFDVADNSILTVSDDGVVTGKAAGKTDITATYLDDAGNAMATSKVTIQVVRASIPVPVPQPDTYTYMSGETTFQWVTKPQGDVFILLNGVQVTDNLPENLKFAPAGNNRVTISLKNPELDQWSDGTTTDKVYTWKVAPKQLNNDSITSAIAAHTYTGKAFVVNAVDPAQELDLTLTDTATSADLVPGVDYTVISYQNNIYVGNETGMVTVQGKGNYGGTKSWSFSIGAAADATVSLPEEVTKTAGSSIDLKTLVTTSGIANFDPSKLTGTGFIFTLEETDKTKATLNGSTLKLNSNLGHGAEVAVTMTYSGSYDANGDGEPEYESVTVDSGDLTIKISSKTQVVSLPVGTAGLVYNGKDQVGVTDGALYNLTGTGTPAAAPAEYPDEDTDNDGKELTAGKYTTIVYLDQSKAPANTTLTWPDGTVAPKRITWEIAKATPTVTISFSPLLKAGDKLAAADIDIKLALGVNGENLTGDAAWEADDTTNIVQGTSYGWNWIPTGDSADNYDKVTGSAILLGNTDGTSTSDDKEEDEDEETTTTVNNPDGSTTEIKRNKETGVTTYTTTGTNGTSSKVVYTNNVLTSATATSSTNGAVAYVPLNSVTWGSVITLRGVDNFDAGLPASGLQGMWVTLPSGSSDLGLRNYSESFPDVSSGSWYAPAVTLASARDLIQGINGYFTPNGTLNFGQIWTMLSRYVGAVSLSQSSGANWYIQPQTWAYNNGISAGTYYADAATREDVAVMMYNTYVRYKGTPSVSTSALSSMSDYGSVSYGARTAVAWAIQTGVIKGYPNSTFQPHNTILRQEAAHMMARFIYVMEGMDIPAEFAS